MPDQADPTADALVELLRETGIGGRLPSERELSERLGVSRTLLRDRLSGLESLGVIQRRTGAGTYVQRLDPERLGRSLDIGLLLDDHTTESLLSVRVALERQAAREAAILQDRVAIAHMGLALDLIRDNADAQVEEQADFDFHDSLLRAAGNASMVFFADALNIPLRRSFAERRPLLEATTHPHELLVRLHEPIFAAITAGDPEAAMAAVDAHFTEFDLARQK